MSVIFKSPATDLRERLERIVLRTARWTGSRWPLPRGKYRLMLLAEALCGRFPKDVRITVPDGRSLQISFGPSIWDTVFFFGEYEPVLTEVVHRVVRSGDICLDIGANFGWYSTLLSEICGPNGVVHAFEPVPETFRLLETNVASARYQNIFLNNFGLGDFNGNTELHLFNDLGSGHSSISDHGRSDTIKVPVSIRRFDDFVADACLGGEVVFLKADIEGAELAFLRGAESLFKQERPPIILMEMALEQAAAFGYKPNDLIEFIRRRRPYRFFAADLYKGFLREIQHFPAGDIGANVIAFPRGCYEDRLERLQDMIN